MFVQTQETPNPNSLKFIPDKKVSNSGSFEITNKDETNNDLVKNILSIHGVTGIFLDEDFLSVNKMENTNWEDVKHIVISLINEYYSDGKESIIDKKLDNEKQADFNEIEKQIVKILESRERMPISRLITPVATMAAAPNREATITGKSPVAAQMITALKIRIARLA